jgi:type IV pilus assembly protein PilE
VNLKRAESRLPAHYSGFTLVELMIACVILAIIVGIAVPSYQAQVRKAHRTDARNALLDIAAREERFLSVANAYSPLPSDVGYSGANWPQNVSNNNYSVAVTIPDPAYLGAGPSFVIVATPIGIQAADTACASFSVTQIGTQTAKDSANVDASALCWGN